MMRSNGCGVVVDDDDERKEPKMFNKFKNMYTTSLINRWEIDKNMPQQNIANLLILEFFGDYILSTHITFYYYPSILSSERARKGKKVY